MGGGVGPTAGSQGGGSAGSGSAQQWRAMDLQNALVGAQVENINADTENKEADIQNKNANTELTWANKDIADIEASTKYDQIVANIQNLVRDTELKMQEYDITEKSAQSIIDNARYTALETYSKIGLNKSSMKLNDKQREQVGEAIKQAWSSIDIDRYNADTNRYNANINQENAKTNRYNSQTARSQAKIEEFKAKLTEKLGLMKLDLETKQMVINGCLGIMGILKPGGGMTINNNMQ